MHTTMGLAYSNGGVDVILKQHPSTGQLGHLASMRTMIYIIIYLRDCRLTKLAPYNYHGPWFVSWIYAYQSPPHALPVLRRPQRRRACTGPGGSGGYSPGPVWIQGWTRPNTRHKVVMTSRLIRYAEIRYHVYSLIITHSSPPLPVDGLTWHMSRICLRLSGVGFSYRMALRTEIGIIIG